MPSLDLYRTFDFNFLLLKFIINIFIIKYIPSNLSTTLGNPGIDHTFARDFDVFCAKHVVNIGLFLNSE
jgi:hypothetical protein